jgi:hypothetical protein
MIRYLTGSTSSGVEAIAFARGIGLMIQPRSACHTKVSLYPMWAADNGAFTRAAGGFSARAFRAMLHQPHLREHAQSCLFVVAPDKLAVLAGGVVIGDAAGTLAQFPAWAAEIRAVGFPVALVAQNGLEDLLDAVPWELVDVLFIGGDDEWKLSDAARVCATEARAHGKGVHMGRVNSYGRLAVAASMLADSADGTFLRFAPTENIGRMLEWFDKLDAGVQVPFQWRAS